MRYDIAVIGGGAAGMAAAVSAALHGLPGREKLKIALLEANPRVGKKLLATGNGRCNLTNLQASPAQYHGDADLAAPVLKEFTPQKIVDFFASLGLLCREQEEGRVYPYSLQAASVLDVLRAQLERFGVDVLCGFPVDRVQKTAAGFQVFGGERCVQAGQLICASGGMAYPQLGANGSGYSLLQSLGHSCTALFPALVQIRTDPRRAKPLKGARCPAKAALFSGETCVGKTEGEVQFTENGLSGICMFELSRLVGESGGAPLFIALDLLPEYPAEQLAEFLRRRQAAAPFLPAGELLCGCLNRLVAQEVMKQSTVNLKKSAGLLDGRELALAAKTAKQFCFPVAGTLSWRDAQVTAGGIPLGEVDGTLHSRLCQGLFLAGEVLNLDGGCGGFNLHWAWSSGILAGRSAALSVKNGDR